MDSSKFPFKCGTINWKDRGESNGQERNGEIRWFNCGIGTDRMVYSVEIKTKEMKTTKYVYKSGYNLPAVCLLRCHITMKT